LPTPQSPYQVSHIARTTKPLVYSLAYLQYFRRADITFLCSYVTALHAQIPLTLHDPSPSVLASALKKLDKLFERDVAKNRISAQDAESARGRVRGVEGDGTGKMGKEVEGDVELVIEVRFWALRVPLPLWYWYISGVDTCFRSSLFIVPSAAFKAFLISCPFHAHRSVRARHHIPHSPLWLESPHRDRIARTNMERLNNMRVAVYTRSRPFPRYQK